MMGHTINAAINAAASSSRPVMMGNGSLIPNSNALASLMMNATNAMRNQALQDMTNEFQAKLQQFLLKDAMIESLIQCENSNYSNVNKSVGGGNPIQNFASIPPPPLYQLAPRAQQQNFVSIPPPPLFQQQQQNDCVVGTNPA